MCEVLDTGHPEPHPDEIGERGGLGRDDEVARPHEHQAGGNDIALDLGHGHLAWTVSDPSASFRARSLLLTAPDRLAGIFAPGYAALLEVFRQIPPELVSNG